MLIVLPRGAKRRRVKPRPPQAPPPALTRIVRAWRERLEAIRVQFSTPIHDDGSIEVGTWTAYDDTLGEVWPGSIAQVADDTIELTFDAVSSGTVGYSGGDPGAISSAQGFPESDQATYTHEA